MVLAYIVIALLWGSIIAYAVLGGADFGGGVWNLLASGSQAKRQQELIEHAIGPVWEANNVWLIYLIVGLFTAFPAVAYTLAIALFVPFTLALLGIVMRGAAFAFETHITHSVDLKRAWGRAFSAASTITPFLLGATAAAVAGGQIRYNHGAVQADRFLPWLQPFALVIGALALSLCATIAAVYLTVEAQDNHDQVMMTAFRHRALLAGFVTSIFGLVGIILAPSAAPVIWQGLTHQALPVMILTMLVGAATAWCLLDQRYHAARVLVVVMTAGLLGAWGLAQLPYIIPPDLTVANAASPPLTLAEFLGSAVVGMAILLPSLWFLFRVFKGKRPLPQEHGRVLDQA
jgi:cytochrome d ubiquinol oxidase subunit II